MGVISRPKPPENDEQAERDDDDADQVFGERRGRQPGVERLPGRTDKLGEHFRGQQRQRRCGNDIEGLVDRGGGVGRQRPESRRDVDADEKAPERDPPGHRVHERIVPAARGASQERAQLRGNDTSRDSAGQVSDSDDEERDQGGAGRAWQALKIDVH